MICVCFWGIRGQMHRVPQAIELKPSGGLGIGDQISDFGVLTRYPHPEPLRTVHQQLCEKLCERRNCARCPPLCQSQLQ